MGDLWQDVRFTFRVLAKEPGFVAAAVVTLALGIGANSTTFCWTNATLLNPIPGMSRASEVVAVNRGRGSSLSYPDFLDLRDRNRSFSGLTAFALWPVSLTGQAKPERVWATLVTSNYFDVLDVKPTLGRGFLPSEDRTANAAPVAVISYRLWQNRFASDPAIVGRTIHIDTHPFTIVGVAPPIFQGSTTGLRTELWLPVTMAPVVVPVENNFLSTRGNSWLNALGRLRRGVGRDQAQAELTTLFQQIARQYPDSHRGENRITGYPLWRAPNGANAFFSKLLPVLMALAGVVLLLACANLANLLLAHGVGRQKELAIRVALGAGRGHLVRQLLVESLILSLAGGVLAVPMTLWTARSFMDFAPVSDLPVWITVSVDRRVLLATLAIAVFTGVLFGALPALRASAVHPSSILKDEAANVAGGRRRSRLTSGLAVAQIALSLLLLVCAGLLVRSFRAARQFNPGFDMRHVLLESYDLFPNGYTDARGIAFDRQVLDGVRALPGVRAASLADWVPLGFSSNGDTFTPEGYVPGPHERIEAGVAHISSGYFATLGIPLVAGRDFNSEDSADSAPVAIVNETVAKRYWPGRSPVGKRIKVEGKWATIVGVARTTNYHDLNEPPLPFLYLPIFQFYSPSAVLHARTGGDPLVSAAAVSAAIHELNSDLPIFDISTLDSRTSAVTFVQHMAGTFAGVFGLLALVLAALGLYGVVSLGARQRTHEMGIRMALGAQPGDIGRMVLTQGAKLALAGAGIGLAASLAGTRLLASLLFGVGAADPLTFLAVTVLLALVALLACYAPARRAMRVDPATALRRE
jgi:predicted permease